MSEAPLYAARYCEENIWHLGHRVADRRAYAVFVSNPDRSVALWCQRASPRPDGLVVWDYHVVLAVDDQVWDLDCTLGLELPRERWIDATFPHNERVPERVPERLRPQLRVLPLTQYHARFSSDRSHMRGADGAWLAPPPPWPAIRPPRSEPTNLMRFVDMETEFVGEVLSLHRFRLGRFGRGADRSE